MHRRNLRVVTAGLAAVLMGVTLLTGCSQATSGQAKPSGGKVDPAVTAQVAKYLAPVNPAYSGSPISTVDAKGKTVWWVTFTSGNPFLAAVGSSFQAALKGQGVNVIACDGKGNPVDVNSCISQGVKQGAAAIEVDGPEPTTFANSLSAAEAAHVPVLSGAAVDASGPLYQGLAAQSSQPFELTGQLAADWIIKDSGAAAHVLFLTVPDVIGSKQEEKAFSQAMTQKCPGCTVSIEGVTLANWASDLTSTTSAALLKNPKINYVVPAFDPMTPFVTPAIQQAGRSSSIKTVTVNGSLEQMQALKAGTVAAEIGIDLNALGYIEADQVLRVMTHNTPVKVAYAPVRIFDASNIGSITVDEASRANGSWFVSSGSFADQFPGRIWKK